MDDLGIGEGREVEVGVEVLFFGLGEGGFDDIVDWLHGVAEALVLGFLAFALKVALRGGFEAVVSGFGEVDIGKDGF